MFGPLLLMLCGIASVVGFAAPAVSFVRHGERGLVLALAGVPGGGLVWAWAGLFVGVAEKVWTVASITPWVLGVLGSIGIVLIALSVRSALSLRVLPGLCPVCGYPVKGLSRCPECGNLRSSFLGKQ